MTKRGKSQDAAPGPFVVLNWARASRYEIRDNLVAPVPGAEVVKTSLWERFLENRRTGTPDPPPHVEFANLAPRYRWRIRPAREKPPDAREICSGWWLSEKPHALYSTRVRQAARLPRAALLAEYDELTRGRTALPSDLSAICSSHESVEAWRASATDIDAVLRWANTYGLSGQLVHRHVEVLHGDGSGRVHYRRTIKGWVSVDTPVHGRDRRPGCLRLGALGEVEQCSPTDWTVGLGAPPLPRPGTAEFFRRYVEPVSVIVEEATRLRTVVEGLSVPQAGGGPDVRWAHARTRLDEMLETGLQLTTAPDGQGRIAQALRCHSPIGCLALMVLEDVGNRSGAWLVQCEHCGAIVRRTNPRAKYCSDAHRNAAGVRRNKARES